MPNGWLQWPHEQNLQPLWKACTDSNEKLKKSHSQKLPCNKCSLQLETNQTLNPGAPRGEVATDTVVPGSLSHLSNHRLFCSLPFLFAGLLKYKNKLLF